MLPRLASPVPEQLHLAAGVLHFFGGMKVDLIFTAEIWANQAPGIKPLPETVIMIAS